mgnify:FL=1
MKDCTCNTHQSIRQKKIEGLGILLSQVDEFLDIQSLANKIYAYMAVLIWNTSTVDFAEAMQDTQFKKAQESAVDLWLKNNPNKFAKYTKGHTTDCVCLAPSVKISSLDMIKLEDLSLEDENACLDSTDEVKTMEVKKDVDVLTEILSDRESNDHDISDSAESSQNSNEQDSTSENEL